MAAGGCGERIFRGDGAVYRGAALTRGVGIGIPLIGVRPAVGHGGRQLDGVAGAALRVFGRDRQLRGRKLRAIVPYDVCVVAALAYGNIRNCHRLGSVSIPVIVTDGLGFAGAEA